MERFKPVAEVVAKLLHPHAEVVLHDLQTSRITAIYNGFSGRQVGDDSLIDDSEGLAGGADVHGPFMKRLYDGRRIKYVSSVLRDSSGEARGLLCINLDVSVFEKLEATLRSFLDTAEDSTSFDELFKDDWQERINSFVDSYLRERNRRLDAMTRADRADLVQALRAAGAFRASGAAGYVARVLGVSRATVYNDLAENHENDSSESEGVSSTS